MDITGMVTDANGGFHWSVQCHDVSTNRTGGPACRSAKQHASSVWLILPASFLQPISAAVPQLWQSRLALLNRWRQIAPMWWCALTPIWPGHKASALCLSWWYCLQGDNCVGCIREAPLPGVCCTHPAKLPWKRQACIIGVRLTK